MIKFNFELDDCEAMNLFEIIKHHIDEHRFSKIFLGKECTEAEIEWRKSHADYVENEIYNVMLKGQVNQDGY